MSSPLGPIIQPKNPIPRDAHFILTTHHRSQISSKFQAEKKKEEGKVKKSSETNKNP
ncbi:conserved hypothetical protein [Ricinus communis]|uniref:Uncharacterized protein n=1 Tax=Ricinus communis TaxID=3988 RepID=B9S107_RICCO|nr:conserved hypothetical protein [Ricinus communis]